MKKNPFLIKSLFPKLPKPFRKKPKFNFLKVFLVFIVVAFTSFSVFIGGILLNAIMTAPQIDEIRNFTFAESTIIYDRTGTHKLFSVHGDENRRTVSLDEISDNFTNAILAAEDDEFFSHPGLDIGGILMAVCHEASSKAGLGSLGGLCPKRGGSTLTQQLIKNVLLTNERTLKRKFQEWYLSWKIEQQMSKEEILELYANNTSFGSISGIETAAQAFFGKKASELTIAEGAILGAIPQRPSYFSPWGNQAFTEITVSEEEIIKNNYTTYEDIENLPGLTIIVGLRGKYIPLADGEVFFPGRANWILKRMLGLGFISETEYEQATQELLEIEFKKFRTNISAPHFTMYVRALLEQQFGKEVVEQGGLKVITTLDYDLQKSAEEIVEKHAITNLENFDAQNAALISIDTKSGQIVSMIGSKDFFDTENDGNVNVILQRRLPGSSFKPVVYATSFLKDLTPATVLFDTETDFGNDWIPQNYDGQFSGPVSIRHALGHSLNIPAIKSCIITGAQNVVDLSNTIGITLNNDAEFYGNAIALGAGEVRPLDMALGFSVFANNGKKVNITPILQIKDREGNILMDNSIPTEPEEVMDSQAAYLMTDILSDRSARGEGWNSRLQLNGRKNAAKTGTSNKRVGEQIWPLDAWTVGYTPDFTTVVWAGNNDASVMNRKGNGFDVAAPIWKEFMEVAHKDIAPKDFTKPEGIKIIPVSRFSGKIPLPETDPELIVKEKFTSYTIPQENDDALQIIEVDQISGKLPNEYTPAEALEKRAILNFHAYFPQNSDWEEPVQKWVAERGKEFVAGFGVEKFMASAPSELDDTHTLKNARLKPIITILSPLSYGIVSPPYINIIPDIVAKNGVQKVQFFWDGELKGESKNYPYAKTIDVVSAQKNSIHKIKVVAIDDLYYSSATEIDVKIGVDETPPVLEIVYPQREQELPANSTVNLLAKAYDNQSAIRRVDFYVDNKRVATALEQPFAVNYQTPAETGKYTLQVIAIDVAGNESSQKLKFITVPTNVKANEFAILKPKDESSYKAGELVEIEIGIKTNMVDNFTELTVFAQEIGGGKTIIAQFRNRDLNEQGIFHTVFTQGQKDTEVYANVKFGDQSFYSERVLLKSK